MLPAAPSPTASSGAQSSAKNHATFVITVPKTASTSLGSKRPAYVSPATQSMTLSVLQGSTSVISQTVGLTPSSTGCTSSLAGLTCTLTLNLNAGTYAASITTYDGANGTGNQLSTAQNVSFTVVANQSNVVPLSLSGIPANIIAMAGNTADSVYVVAEDADGNFIVGSGAPTFTAAKSSGASVATIDQPTSTAPNTISFSLPSPAPSPGTESVGVTASYPSGQTNACTGSAVCTLATPITISYANPTAFVDNYDGSLIGYTLPLTSNTQAPSYSLSESGESYWGIASNASGDVFWANYDDPTTLTVIAPPYTSNTSTNTSGTTAEYNYGSVAAAPNGDVFVPGYYNSTVSMYTPPYTGTPTEITTGLDEPYGATAGSDNTLYVANERNDTVSAYASGSYTGTPVIVNTSSAPVSVVTSSSYLFVGEGSGIDVFSLPLNSGAAPVATLSSGASNVYALAVDHAGDLWAACWYGCTASNDGAIYEFTAPFTSGKSPAVTLAMPASGFSSDEPTGLGFDGAGNLYVENYRGGAEAGGLLEYSGTITSSSTPAHAIETSIIEEPYGMTITPSVFAVTP